MIDLLESVQGTPALHARTVQFARVLEAATVTLEVLVALGGLLVLSAALFLVFNTFNAQVNLNDFDINASGFYRP